MALQFRQVAAQEIDQLLSLISLLYAHEGIAFDPGRTRAAAERLMLHPEWGAAWIFDADGETAGYMVITIGYSLEFGGNFGLLDELYVEDAWRDQGLGRRAVVFAEDWCRAHALQALRLEVGHDNARALGLYMRTGFEVLDRHFLTKRL